MLRSESRAAVETRRLDEADFAELRRKRAEEPGCLRSILASRQRRPLIRDDGRLFIVAADHPARGALGIRGDELAMADRYDLLDRLATALSRPGVDGVLGTPDIIDDLALLEALQTDAFYVGAIGSRRNNDARRERLREHFDVTDDQLARLRGPIGIYIGSKTPPEIAVSVMAEILAVKNGVPLPRDMAVATAKDRLDPVASVSGPVCGTMR